MSRDRLVKLLGMLGSDFDGERANAARMIANMAKQEGKGIAEYVMQGGPQIIYRDRIVEKTVYRDPPKPEPSDDDLRSYRPRPGSKGRKSNFDLVEGLQMARNYPQHLTEFEREFIDSVLAEHLDDSDLSPRQAKVARRIIAKIDAYEGDPLV